MVDKGFDENFLGSGFLVALPEHDFDVPPVLKYTHFSVLLNGERRLAYFTAFNSKKPLGSDRSNKWHYDARISRDWQAGAEFYDNNPYDRGHLAAREFVEWGGNVIGDDADVDSFTWTNIAPQHTNMHTSNGREWSAMEDHLQEVMDTAVDTRMSLFAGCVFADNDIAIKAKGKNDFLQVPQKFWCVAVWVDKASKKLQAKAYVIENYRILPGGDINNNPATRFDPNKTTSIAEIERLTNVKFPNNVRAAALGSASSSSGATSGSSSGSSSGSAARAPAGR